MIAKTSTLKVHNSRTWKFAAHIINGSESNLLYMKIILDVTYAVTKGDNANFK